MRTDQIRNRTFQGAAITSGLEIQVAAIERTIHEMIELSLIGPACAIALIWLCVLGYVAWGDQRQELKYLDSTLPPPLTKGKDYDNLSE